jgi:hypothetical protein
LLAISRWKEKRQWLINVSGRFNKWIRWSSDVDV